MISTQILIYTIFNTICVSTNVAVHRYIRKALDSLTGAHVPLAWASKLPRSSLRWSLRCPILFLFRKKTNYNHKMSSPLFTVQTACVAICHTIASTHGYILHSADTQCLSFNNRYFLVSLAHTIFEQLNTSGRKWHDLFTSLEENDMIYSHIEENDMIYSKVKKYYCLQYSNGVRWHILWTARYNIDSAICTPMETIDSSNVYCTLFGWNNVQFGISSYLMMSVIIQVYVHLNVDNEQHSVLFGQISLNVYIIKTWCKKSFNILAFHHAFVRVSGAILSTYWSVLFGTLTGFITLAFMCQLYTSVWKITYL